MQSNTTVGRFLLVALIGLFVLDSAVFGAVPGVVDNYINVFVDLAKGSLGIIFIILVLGMSGFMAWRNGNMTPLFWGLAAAILIGAAPYVAPKLINFGSGL